MACVSESMRFTTEPSIPLHQRSGFDCEDGSKSSSHPAKWGRCQQTTTRCAISVVFVAAVMIGFFTFGPLLQHALVDSEATNRSRSNVLGRSLDKSFFVPLSAAPLSGRLPRSVASSGRSSRISMGPPTPADPTEWQNNMPQQNSELSKGVVPPTTRRHAVLGAAAATVAVFSALSPAAAAAVEVDKTWKLANGVVMPVLALNTAGLSAEGSERAMRAALAAGISHVDFHPGIERDGVAKAIAGYNFRKLVPRSQLFLTTKIRKPAVGTAPAAAAELVRTQVEEDLGILGVDKVDMLMLRDSPDCEVMQAQWDAMEGVLKSGRARSIGVINYCEGSLRCILKTAKVKPAVNYIMQHVGMGYDALGLRAFGESRGIRTFAYGALGEPGPEPELLTSTTLKQIGEKNKRSVEEVALRWVLQGGCAVSVRPTTDFGLGRSMCAEGTSACVDGLRTRAQAFDWALSRDDMASLDAITSPPGNPTLFSSTFCPDSFFANKGKK